MARTVSSPKVKQASKKKTRAATSSLQTLQKLRNLRVEEFTSVKNTNRAYSGHLARGVRWLEEVVDQRRKASEEICAHGISTEELSKAFENPPNHLSAVALEMFLVQKCFTQNCGKDTADGIHGAFAAYWDTMDGDNYAGPYTLDEATGKVHGCPARAPAVTAVVQAVKIRAASKGASATRNHADAMTIEDIQKLVQWSEKVCPDELLTCPIDSLETLKFCQEHAMMRAFASTAFTLWTRCFELLSLQVSDIQENCFGPAPYYIPHFKVTLENRKGWQKQQGYEGPRTSNTYDIYPQDIHEIDMSTHLSKWRAFLQMTQLGREAEDDDFIFPYIAPNGLVHPKRETSYDIFLALLKKFSVAAGIEKGYTTHSFRRGGAQYRFMYAPLGSRWSLARIRWWGGWAVGEHVDTLIKYLVDSLQSFETGHGNALHPIPINASQHFMGDNLAMRPASAEEIRQMTQCVDRKLESFMNNLSTLPCHLPRQSNLKIPTKLSLPPSPNFSYTALAQPQTRKLVHNNTATYDGATARTIFVDNPAAIIINTTPPAFSVSIPDLGRAPGAWRRAISQWETIDPATKCSLRDWPVEWYTGSMRTITGSKRGQRQTIFEEYERLGRDEAHFLAEYPDADRSIIQLLADIRDRRNRKRNGKYSPSSGQPNATNMSH